MALRDVQAVVTITTNAVKAIDDGKKLKQVYADINAQLNDMRARKKTGSPEFKELQKLAEDTKAKINEMLRGMQLVDKVMNNMSGHIGKDLNRALRETSKEFNKTSSSTDQGRAKLERLRQAVASVKKELSDRKGLTMSFADAQKQMTNLNNTKLDKLKLGLAAIRAELDNPNIGNKWRRQLEQMAASYNAAIAARQTNISNRPVSQMNAQQLNNERTALMAAMASTQGVKGYEGKTSQYEQRLKAVNEQLKLLAENEKKADQAAKELQATQQAMATVNAVNKGQKVSLDELTQAYKTLQAQYQKLAGVDPFKAKQTQQNMKMLEAEIKKLNGSLLTEEELQKRIGNTGKYSVKQLQEAYQALQVKLNNLNTSETTAIRATQRQMKALQQEINRATGQVTGFAKAWQTAKQNIMMYVGVFAIVNKIRATLSAIVEKNKELGDSMANIRKVSQWASADVVKLTENLAKIDTRNTITTLQNLAYQGAKLGIGQYGVEGLTGFVRAAEQVQTALGEDLQEDALPALAKMTEVMGLIPKLGVEQAMQKAGSAIYQLGATSTATGRDIVEFSKRIMGLANVSGVSADQLLGLSAASSTMAIMPEVGATAFNKLFNSIHSNTEGIAKAVGIAKEELEGLLYEGRTMDALVKVFEKMQTMSMKELEGRGVFKELGSDGARLTNVMITMANKVDMLKTSLQTANEAFTEGKAVINEYLIQQETASAYFERAANIWTKSFVNPEGVDIVKQLAQEWYNVSYEMTHSASTMASINFTLQMLANTVKTLIQLLPTLVQLMMFYGVGSALQAIFLEFRAIYQAATLAGSATAKFNALLKTNAIALAITGVMMLCAKLYEMSEASKAAAEEEAKRQKIFTDAAAESLQVYNDQAKALDKYYEALKKTNSTEEERNDIINKFKNEFGTYLEKLGIEIKTYGDMESALRRVNKELKEKAYYETGQKLRESYVGDARGEQTNALSRYMQAAQKYNIPTTVMEDIMEGKITDPAKAIQQVYNNLYGKQYGTGGKLNWIPGKPYQYWVGNQSNVRTTIPTGGATGWVMDKLTGGQATQTEEIYNAVTNLVNATKEVNDRETQVTKFMDQYAGSYSPQISVDGAILNLKKLKELNEDKLNEGLNVLRDEWKEMSETERGTDRGKQIGGAIAQYSKQLRSMRGEGYEAPPTAKEIAKQQSEAKQRMRKDMKDAQEASTGIISKLEEYYRLQETAISEARADGKLTEDQAKEMVRSLNIFKNESLATARRAVVTGDTKEWDKLKTTILPAVLSDTSEVSRTLLETIQKVLVEKLHDDLAKFNGTEGVFGLSSRAFFDQMRAKAAGNEREAARLRAKIQNEVEKALLQYQFVEKANQQMRKDVENMGITTETYEQWAKRMQQGIEEKPDTRVAMGQNARDEILQQFKWDWEQRMQQPARTFNGEWNPASFPFNSDNEEQVQEWFRQFVTNAKWTSGIPKLQEWLKDGEKYKAEIRKFYESLILIQESSMQKSESVSPLAPVDETWMKRGQQGLDDLFSYSISDEQAYRQMGNKFMDMGVINFRYNIDNEEEARQWVKQFATDARGDLEGWAQAFPQLSEWIDLIKRKEQGETLGEAEQKALEEAMPAIRNLFDEMMRHADRLNKAMKDAFQHEKEQQESRFRIAGYKDQEEQTDKVYSNQAKQQETGAGQNFVQMLGLGSIANDPEILQIQNRIRWRAMEVEDAQRQLDALKAQQDERIAKLRETAASEAEIHAMEQQHAQDRAGLEQLLMDRQTALTEQTTALTTQTMQELQKRSQAILKLSKPFTDAANSIGKKLGDMIRGAEEDSITWEEIWKNMALAVGEAMIEMGAQYLQNLIMQQSINRASEAEEAAHVATEVPMGIAAGSAKTIGQLGWWGIPLVAVISALLMGLLQAALSSNRDSSSANAAKPKIKLASGMLTYDEGNVQTVVGDDGRVYRAKEQRSLPEGVSMVTEPIATRVNGQAALVGERGPEIVIGRKTTRAIQMNRPDLLRDLALIDRGITTRKVRTFDEGNISDMATAFAGQLPAPQQSADGQQGGGDAQRERDQAMLATLGVLSQTIGQLQQQLAAGIHAEMNMFGDNGAYKKFQQADKFYKKYGG